jgi:putative ABC transport system permease protein
VTIQIEKIGSTTLRVAGTYANKGAYGDYLVSLDTFARATGRTVDTMLMVKGAGTEVGPLQARIGALLGSYPGAKVLDQRGFKRATAATLDQILNLITALLALAIVIALLGIVNTLALSVVERTRELGLLRAIGMRRSQLGAMVACEAMIIAVLGAVLGVTLGVGLGSALAGTLTASNGSAVVTVPGAQLALYVIGAGAAGIVAAIAPARRAANLDMLTAISSQ